jgi:ATP-binding cassette subfamily B protein RaxB
MVSDYFGDRFELVQLRQAFPVSANGTNLAALISAAAAMGLGARALRVELEALRCISDPVIIHWNLNHFVVLESVRGQWAIIHDPGIGRRRVRFAELSHHFSGVVLELFPRAEFVKRDRRERLKFWHLWSKSTGLWAAALQIIAVSALVQVLAIIPALQLQVVVDQMSFNGGSEFILLIGLGFAAAVCFQAIATGIRDWTVQVVGSKILLQLTGNVQSHLVRLPIAWFEKRQVGDVISRLNALGSLKDLLGQGVISVAIDSVSLILVATFMVGYSAWLALVVFAFASLGVVFSLVTSKLTIGRSSESLLAAGVEQTHVIESLRAMSTIKIMGQEQIRVARWRDLATETINKTLTVSKIASVASSVNIAIAGLQTVSVLCIGALLVQAGTGFSLGMLMTFYALSLVFSDRLRSAAAQVMQFRMVGLHLDRLGDIVLEPAESDQLMPSRSWEGGIECCKLWFRYGVSDPWVLRDVSLNVAPGDFLAIVGPSGMGKSTLIRLLLGVLEPSKGEILLDGEPANASLWRSWRSQVGVVGQSDTLFSGTFYDNICLFDPSARFADVEAAAKAAQINDEITRLPLRYQTRIGDMGSSLSAGQKQRLMLARALYRRPRILVLDEGTANLDETNERRILEIVRELPITRIIVTHKASVAALADRVVSLQAGHLLELDRGRTTRKRDN